MNILSAKFCMLVVNKILGAENMQFYLLSISSIFLGLNQLSRNGKSVITKKLSFLSGYTWKTLFFLVCAMFLCDVAIVKAA